MTALAMFAHAVHNHSNQMMAIARQHEIKPTPWF